jgi:hypothetical protein
MNFAVYETFQDYMKTIYCIYKRRLQKDTTDNVLYNLLHVGSERSNCAEICCPLMHLAGQKHRLSVRGTFTCVVNKRGNI